MKKTIGIEMVLILLLSACESESIVEKLAELDSKGIYPLLNNPVIATTAFDPTFSLPYSTSSVGTAGGIAGGSSGGGGTGAFYI